MNNNQQNGIGTRLNLKAGSLKEHSIKGVSVTFTEQILMLIMNTLSVAVLARLLTPEDYGTVAMVTAITGFVALFREFGLSMATIQSKVITHEQASALFWINVGIGVLMTLIIIALGPVLTWFYHKPELSLITAAISVTSIINSLSIQHGALLSRQMRFGIRAIVNVSSHLAGFIVAVIIALSGGRYWALVANLVVVAIWHTMGLWFVSDFRPGRFKRGANIRLLLKFGANIAASNLFNYFHRNADNILIGRAWGAEQLGLYAKAYSLLMLPMQNLRLPLGRVAFTVLSRIQNDPVQYRNYFNKYCTIVGFITMPFVVYLFVCAENVIRILLGPRWLPAAELFSILAVVSFIQSVATLRGTVLMTLGHSTRYFRWYVYNGIATVASFFAGLPWGARGVAIAYSIVTYLILHPSLMYAYRDSPLRCADFYRSIAKPAVASLAMGAIIFFLRNLIIGLPDIVLLTTLVIISVLVYIGIYWVLPGGKHEIIDYWGYALIFLQSVRSRFSKAKNSKAESKET